MKFTVGLAGKNIGICSFFDSLRDFCQDYLTEGAPDLSIAISPADIAFERQHSAREDRAEGRPVRQFSDAYLETLAAYRKIAEELIQYNTLLFHGSLVAVDGQGYLFTAKSGTGKSTHSALWRQLLGDRAVVVNDDKPLLRITDHGVIAYGTPWDGKHRRSANMAVPLQGLGILNRARDNSIRLTEGKEVYPLILQQTHRPSDPRRMLKTLELVDELIKNVPLYIMGCNMDIEAAKMAYETMSGGKMV